MTYNPINNISSVSDFYAYGRLVSGKGLGLREYQGDGFYKGDFVIWKDYDQDIKKNSVGQVFRVMGDDVVVIFRANSSRDSKVQTIVFDFV